jgi:hypothetical protein
MENKYLVLQCSKNRGSIDFLASNLNGYKDWETLADVWNEKKGYIKWGIGSGDATKMKKLIIKRIAEITEKAKDKVNKDKLFGSINNVPLWGQQKISVDKFLKNPPCYEFKIQ